VTSVVEHDEINDCFPSPFVGLSMTLAEFYRRRLHLLKPYLELIDGVVCQRDAFWLHQSAVREHLLTVLEGVDGRRHHGIALPSLDCIVGEQFFVPAGSYFRKSTLRSRGITSFEGDWGLPDIVIEIIPVETCGYMMLEKCHRYLEIGIPVAMLVDADEESVQILRSNQPPVIVRGDQPIDLSDVIPGFDLTAAALFRDAVPDWLRSRGDQAEDDAAASGRSEG
jgi:Uma2 family endonuclease